MIRSLLRDLKNAISGKHTLFMEPDGFRNWGFDLYLPRSEKENFWKSTIAGEFPQRATSSTNHVLVCALHKSASLHITELLSQCLTLQNFQLGFNRKGGNVYFPRVMALPYLRTSTISHSHALPEPDIVQGIETFGLTPVVLTRGILDALVSRRDMVVKNAGTVELLHKEAISHFLAASSEKQLEITIDLFAPEFCNFVSAWKNASVEHGVPVTFITYEQFVSDPFELVQAVANAAKVAIDDKVVMQILEKNTKTRINFNRGGTGRGREEFSEQQIERVVEIASRYALSENEIG